jgi:hypothetical protein
MNCEEVKEKIYIRTVLESFNLFPVKENRKTAFYFALDREEKFLVCQLILSKIKPLILELEKVMM